MSNYTVIRMALHPENEKTQFVKYGVVVQPIPKPKKKMFEIAKMLGSSELLVTLDRDEKNSHVTYRMGLVRVSDSVIASVKACLQ